MIGFANIPRNIRDRQHPLNTATTNFLFSTKSKKENKNLLNFLDERGVKAYGMSSFGPSVIGITESDKEAEELFGAVHNHLRNTGGHIYICKPNNTGAKIEYLE